MRKQRRQINTFLPEDVSRDLEALKIHFGDIHYTSVVRIAIKRLAQSELRQNQTAPPGIEIQREAA